MSDEADGRGGDTEAEVARLRERVAELERSEARLRRLVGSASEVFVSADAHGTVTYVSDSVMEVLGYTPEAYTAAQRAGELTHPDDQPKVAASLARVLQDPTEQVRLDFRARHADGSWRWLEARGANLLDDPLVGALVTAMRDVTESRSSEKELVRVKGSLEEAQRLAGVGSWDWDLTSGDGWWSDQLYRLHGRDPTEGVPPFDPHQDHIHAEDREVLAGAIARSFETGRYEATYRIRRYDDGEERVIHATGEAVTGDGGQPRFFRGVATDITEERRAVEEAERLAARLQQAQRLESLAVLAGGVAHDFNNILVAILGNAALARMDAAPDSPVQESLANIEAAARRASVLSGQMLAYSGGGSFVVEPVDLNDVVWDLTHLLDAAVPERVAIRLDLAVGLPAVMADAAQLRQVVMSLVTNAAEAMEEVSGVVAIRSGVVEANRAYLARAHLDEGLAEGTYAYLEVTDTGAGMDEATLAKVFDPFFSTKFTGRGLGLSAMLGIVRGLDGAVIVDSRPGRGSAFRVLLPVTDAPVVATAQSGRSAAPAEELPRVSGTVLVIDDEEEVRFVAKRALERSGYRVLAARDGEEGLQIFKSCSGEVSLVLLDLKMPRLDGQQTLVRLREVRPDVRVVLMSGYSEQESLACLEGLRLEGFLKKPFGLQALTGAVLRGLG